MTSRPLSPQQRKAIELAEETDTTDTETEETEVMVARKRTPTGGLDPSDTEPDDPRTLAAKARRKW